MYETFKKQEKFLHSLKWIYDKQNVDVPCEYEIGVDTTLTENLDKIVLYNGKILFTSYGRIFTVGS